MTPEVSATIAQARAALQPGGGGIQAARAAIESALREHSESIDLLAEEVRILIAQRQTALAFRLVEEYIRCYPHNARAGALLATLLWDRGDREEAAAEVRAALAREPHLAEARESLIHWTMEMGRAPEALQLADAGLTLDATDTRWRHARANALFATNRSVEGRTEFEALLAEHPNHLPAATDYLRLLLMAKEAKPALAFLESMPEPLRAAPMIRRLALDAVLQVGDQTRAEAILSELCRDESVSEQSFHTTTLLLLARSLPQTTVDSILIGELRRAPVAEVFALALIDYLNSRRARQQLRDAFAVIGADPLRYPRAVARFLATAANALGSDISSWIAQYYPQIQQNTILWGGLGAYFVAAGHPRHAVDLLRDWQQRTDVQQWMLLVLARAHEILNQTAEMQRTCRAALLLQVDQSEVALRTKLAWSLALEGNTGSALIFVRDLPAAAAARYATALDTLQMKLVEALFQLESTDDAEHFNEIRDEAIAAVSPLAKVAGEPGDRAIAAFRKRALEL